MKQVDPRRTDIHEIWYENFSKIYHENSSSIRIWEEEEDEVEEEEEGEEEDRAFEWRPVYAEFLVE